jgi:hypothetical protein
MHGTANQSYLAYISLQVGKNSGGLELKARWKGFTEGEDTWEPITNQAEDNPELVKEYLKISTEEAKPIKSTLKSIAVVLPKKSVEILMVDA